MLNAEVTKILFESEELKAERDALAALVVELRGALEERDAQIDHLFRHSGRKGSEDYDSLEVSAAWARLRCPMPALSVPLPDAAERLAGREEKAELLDWLQENTIYLDDGRIVDIGGKHSGNLLSALRAARGAQ